MLSLPFFISRFTGRIDEVCVVDGCHVVRTFPPKEDVMLPLEVSEYAPAYCAQKQDVITEIVETINFIVELSMIEMYDLWYIVAV